MGKREANLPYKMHDSDAGLDLIANRIISSTKTQITYGTGIHVQIPQGCFGMIVPRSSIRKKNLRLSNSVGIIDADYRGEIEVTFDRIHKPIPVKMDENLYKFEIGHDEYDRGNKIAQLIIVPFINMKPVRVETLEELGETERGQGGFGSTGV